MREPVILSAEALVSSGLGSARLDERGRGVSFSLGATFSASAMLVADETDAAVASRHMCRAISFRKSGVEPAAVQRTKKPYGIFHTAFKIVFVTFSMRDGGVLEERGRKVR